MFIKNREFQQLYIGFPVMEIYTHKETATAKNPLVVLNNYKFLVMSIFSTELWLHLSNYSGMQILRANNLSHFQF